METSVLLIRHGVTTWHKKRRVLGQRDIDLDDEGHAQGDAIAKALEGLNISEVVSSPLGRAVQTASKLAASRRTDVTRDPRLVDFRVGKWEGMGYDEVSATQEYKDFLRDPLSVGIPGGEQLIEVRDRAVGAIEQALEDTPAGDRVAVVTHAGIVRILLAHYMGAKLANYHRVRVAPGSVSVLSFSDGIALPRVLVTNWMPALQDSIGD